MDKKTAQGDELMKDVLGFKLFIEKAEKHKIEYLSIHYYTRTYKNYVV
jgi:hypothetical protein